MKNANQDGRRAFSMISGANQTFSFGAGLIVIVESLMQLSKSQSLFAPYLIAYLLGIVSYIYMYTNPAELFGKIPKRVHSACNAAAGFFTVLISAANYSVWLECPLGANTPSFMRIGYGGVMLAFVAGGCFLVFRAIFYFTASHLHRLTWQPASYPECRGFNPRSLFFISFFAISFVYLFVLYLIKYPGLIAPDTIHQFYECRSGDYSNYNPLFSTLLIKPFVAVGMSVFGNMNACVAMYCTAQAVFVAFSFACVVKALAEMRAPLWLLISTVLFYALTPYHIMFSIGHSKDVLFSNSVMLFCVVLFDLMKKPDAPLHRYIFLFATSLGFCLMRNNGILAFLFFIPVYCIISRMKNKRIVWILISAILLSFCLTRPVLRALGIPQSDWVESCSLPTQQVARAVIDHNDLTPAEFEILNPVMKVSEISETYNPGISDPIKSLMRRTMQDHPESVPSVNAFLKLWIHLGLRHPITYLKAFVDITCGYWNGGYIAAPWCNFIYKNNMGIHLTYPVPLLNMVFDRYIGLFDDFYVLQLTVCTGLFVWMYFFFTIFCYIRRDRTGLILCAPVLCVVQTLLMGTPVACDLRYIYCAFCALPFVLGVSTRRQID